MISHVLLDLAGVIYDGNQPIPGAIDAVTRLRDAGLGIRFLTNTTRTPRRTLLQRLHGMGLPIADEELFTPARAACDWLTAKQLSPYLLVHPALLEDFAGLPKDKTEAVVVGDAAQGFTYDALNAAFRKLIKGTAFVALARNRSFKDDDGMLSLDTGAFVAALEYASHSEAVLLGKPSPDFFYGALASLGSDGKDAVMVGDDAEADVAGALTAGLGAALLVRTGKYRPGDERKVQPAPSDTVADLAAAVQWILDRRAVR
jgi:HAD superfamily hydrolase (TIGR01458 family)